jgi:tRNA(fMet)-specific endonuclease VapC
MLDTSVLVAAERGHAELDGWIADDDDVAIAAVTAAELWVGVALADPRRRPKRTTFVEQVIASLPVEDYDLAVAEVHARLLAEVKRSGRPRVAHDLMIAATAIARGRTVVTRDRDGFAGISELELRVV